MLRLGHWLEPLHALSTRPKTQLELLNTVLGLLNDVSDDVYCLSKIGLIDGVYGKIAEPWSNRLWMSTILLDMQELVHQHSITKGEERYWIRIILTKLFGDLMFCAYDMYKWEFSEAWPIGTGMASGVLGAYKLWHKTSKM
jgi:hypothetical protein